MSRKILIAVSDYPNNESHVSLMYVHTRNKKYFAEGLDIVVLNFSAKMDYTIEGIEVKAPQKNLIKEGDYDILICHAPNLRNHYKFLILNKHKFSKIIFFFHGREILDTGKVYPKPYKYKQKKFLNSIFSKCYDILKIKLWRNYFINERNISDFVFVSNSLYEEFLEHMKVRKNDLKGQVNVISNNVGEIFEIEKYETNAVKKYDFITIRNYLDGSNYGVDIVNNLAKANSDLKFLILGKGDFFLYNTKPTNVIWLEGNFPHENLLEYINSSKCGLMPTRRDTQGVMTCELLTFGIPVITSNIAICKEVFSGFENVAFIENDDKSINLEPILKKLSLQYSPIKQEKYYSKNTVSKEIELIKMRLEEALDE